MLQKVAVDLFIPPNEALIEYLLSQPVFVTISLHFTNLSRIKYISRRRFTLGLG